jgi:serine/threonine protein kinase
MKLIVCLKMIKVDKLPVSKFAQKWEREYASLTSQFIHCCKDTEWVEKATVVERLGAGSFGEVEKVVDPDHPDSCLARKRNKRNDAKFLRGNPNGRYGLLVEKFLEYMVFPQRLVTDKFAWHFNEQDLVLDIYMRVFTPVMQSKVRFGKKECRVLGEELVNIHGKGLAHRDIKSANVFEGRLCDYGLSTWQSSTYFCGTPIFLAPELWQRKLTTDESVDLRNCDWWAFGVFMLEMFLRDNKEAWEKHVAPKYHRNKWWSTSLERYPAAEFSNDGGPALLYRREILPIALALIQEGIIPQKTAQDFPVELVRACLKKNPSERQEAVMVALEKLIREQEQKFDPTEASFGACSTAVPSTFSGTTFGTVVGDTASTHESHQVC